MIIHRLIALHWDFPRNEEAFFRLQAADAVAWLERGGVKIGPQSRVLDLGAGHGYLGQQCLERGCQVTFADLENQLLAPLRSERFLRLNLDADDLSALGQYDVVLCSNVLEHLSQPNRLLAAMSALLYPGGVFYLSWTNWLSPWGGHEFSPFHYLGPRLGVRLHDLLRRRPRVHTPYKNLFPTSIGGVLRQLRAQKSLRLQRMAPRYYPELVFLVRVPLLREFVTWNCALHIVRVD